MNDRAKPRPIQGLNESLPIHQSIIFYDGDYDMVGDESYCFDTDNNQTIYTFIRSIKLLLVLVVAQESIMIDATVTAAAAALQTCCPLLPTDLISTTQLSAAGYSFAFK
jgi:hypothetical protein